MLANYVPGFRIRAAEELYKFGSAADASFVLLIAFLGVLLARDAQAGKPVLPFAIGLVEVLGMFAHKLIAIASWWEPLAMALASVPAWLVVAVGLALGSAANWFGWQHPAKGKPASLERRRRAA